MSTTTTSIKAEVLSIIEQLSPDELRIFRFMGRRMVDIGHVKYGPLDLKVMKRVWSKETAQETADRLFYVQCQEIAEEDARAERVAAFKYRDVDLRASDFDERDCIASVIVSAEAAIPSPEATFEVRSGEPMEVIPPGARAIGGEP